MAPLAVVLQPKELGEEFRAGFLVPGGNNRVIESDWHRMTSFELARSGWSRLYVLVRCGQALRIVLLRQARKHFCRQRSPFVRLGWRTRCRIVSAASYGPSRIHDRRRPDRSQD